VKPLKPATVRRRYREIMTRKDDILAAGEIQIRLRKLRSMCPHENVETNRCLPKHCYDCGKEMKPAKRGCNETQENRTGKPVREGEIRMSAFILGIDPGETVTICCWAYGNRHIFSHWNLLEFDVAFDLNLGSSYDGSGEGITVCIEDFHAGKHFHTLHFITNAIQRNLKRRYPKMRIIPVRPQTWQKVMLSGWPGEDPKARSLAAYNATVKPKVPETDDNRSDAYWLMTLAEKYPDFVQPSNKKKVKGRKQVEAIAKARGVK